MNRKTFILAIVCAFGATGCASSTYEYTSPMTHSQIKTERLIPIDFGEFWDAYVAELSKTFFVINNIEKESRIINVSFNANTPSEYIDCGYVNRTSSHPSTGKRLFNYKLSDSASYQIGVRGTNILWDVNRSTSLDGRINVFMAPEGDQTLLRVNALYVWSVSASGTNQLGQAYLFPSTSITFSSGKAGEKEEQGEKFQCRSKGVLEKVLLELVGTSK